MKTIYLDLEPGTLQTPTGSPFSVSIDEWKRINIYLTNVADADAKTTANIVKVIPSFATLKPIADKWKPTTLPDIVKLAEGMYNYGKDTIGGKFPELEKLVKEIQSKNPGDSLTAFRAIMKGILAETRTNTNLAGGIVDDLALLDNTLQTLRREAEDYISGSLGSPGAPNIGEIVAIAEKISQLASLLSAVGTPPKTDIERIRGRWAAITNDLDNFQTSVAAEISENLPFIISLNLDSAISQWTTLGAQALQFAKNIGEF